MAFKEAAEGLAHSRRFKFAERHRSRLLTVKWRGRATTPAGRRGRTISLSARGAKQTTHHGTLQRLLGVRSTRGIRAPRAVSEGNQALGRPEQKPSRQES